VQTITIDNVRFERYRKSPYFVQQYIFPDDMFPSPAVFAKSAERHGLSVVNHLSFGQDYARA
jgi:cyclopropane-fatty-acyl-phospholipid synthase